jgi:hypothetical protein
LFCVEQRVPLGLHSLDLLEQQFEPIEFSTHLGFEMLGQATAIASLERIQPRSGVVKVTGFTAAQGDTPFVTNALRGKCAPLRQCHRASLLVNLPGDEMPLLIEMVVDLGVN